MPDSRMLAGTAGMRVAPLQAIGKTLDRMPDQRAGGGRAKRLRTLEQRPDAQLVKASAWEPPVQIVRDDRYDDAEGLHCSAPSDPRSWKMALNSTHEAKVYGQVFKSSCVKCRR